MMLVIYRTIQELANHAEDVDRSGDYRAACYDDEHSVEQIGVLENMLQGKGFFRCHKSYLINLKHVDGYNRQEAILDNGERILIAKRRYEGFCREILRYMRHNGGIG